MRASRIAAGALVCLSLASVASARSRDHLTCYKTGTDFAGASVRIDDTNGGTDPGSGSTFGLKKAKDFCVPSDIDGSSAIDPNSPWVFYAGKRGAGHCSGDVSVPCKDDGGCTMGTCVLDTPFDKKNSKNLSVRVWDSKTNTRLDFGKEVGVLAPTKLGGTSPDAGSRDFFKCYAVKPSKASCTAGPSLGEACKEDADCGLGGICTANGKLFQPVCVVSVLHLGEACSSNLDCGYLGICAPPSVEVDDAYAPETDQNLKKIKMVCQSGEENGNDQVHAGTALMCYATKQASGGEFVPPAPVTASNSLGGAGKSYELAKRDLVCSPACIGDTAAPPVFTQYVLKATTLAIGPDGHPGHGVDVDGNPMTCSPAGLDSFMNPKCSGGIDNAFAALATLANPSLEDAVNGGSINLLLELSNFENGTQKVAGYIGNLASPANCTDINDGNQTCDYDVQSIALAPGDLCREESLISVPVVVSGKDTPPNATANGDGGQGSTFAIALSLGGFNFALSIQNVKIDIDLTHDGMNVTGGNGVLGGGLPLATLRAAISSVQGSCSGGMNAGTACSSHTQCDSGVCSLIGSQSPEDVAAYANTLLLPDIDLDGKNNCQPGMSGTNNFEECDSPADCTDDAQTCAPNEAISLSLMFNLIDANIVGVE